VTPGLRVREVSRLWSSTIRAYVASVLYHLSYGPQATLLPFRCHVEKRFGRSIPVGLPCADQHRHANSVVCHRGRIGSHARPGGPSSSCRFAPLILRHQEHSPATNRPRLGHAGHGSSRRRRKSRPHFKSRLHFISASHSRHRCSSLFSAGGLKVCASDVAQCPSSLKQLRQSVAEL
jgi:hypothetical protein